MVAGTCGIHNLKYDTNDGFCPECHDTLRDAQQKEWDMRDARVKAELPTAPEGTCRIHGLLPAHDCPYCNPDGEQPLKPLFQEAHGHAVARKELAEGEPAVTLPAEDRPLSETMTQTVNPNPMFKGYRELNAMEIERINRIKSVANDVRNLCQDVKIGQFSVFGEDISCQPDQRWIAIAETHFQEGFMALTRAIAKPESF